MDLISPVVRRWVQDARENPEAFWGRAAEQLPWLRTWDRVFEWTPPTFRWFVGGQTNLAYNALDHHVDNGWGGHTALVYLNERGERRLFTYAQLTHEVERVAAALRGLGVQKGDRITIYMPTCPEAIMLMLAAVRIGALHLYCRRDVSERQEHTAQRDRGCRLENGQWECRARDCSQSNRRAIIDAA